MLRRQSSSVIRLTSSHVPRPRHYYRHQPLSIRSAVRPTSRSSHHPTNLPQIYPRSSSPSSRRNSTLSSSKMTATPSRRMRFVRRFVETAALSSVVFGTYYYIQSRNVSSSSSSTSHTPDMPRKTLEIEDFSNPYQPRRKVLQLLTPEECTTVLRAHEESYLISRGNGVYRYDVNQIASNDPIEDDRVEQIIAAPNPSATTGSDNPIDVTKGISDFKTGVKNASGEYGDWMFWALFDGHSGWYTSDLLKRQLVPYVVRELSNLYSQGKITNDTTPLQSPPSSLAVDQAIQRGFTALDDEIVLNSVKRLLKNPSKRLAADILLPANAGSCALLTFFDSQTGRLKVACTGDSRAILGRKDAKTGKWTVEVLSVDQTGNNLDEANRLRKEHPGEERDVIRRGRVLGQLEPTRAFGDARYKLPPAIQEKLQEYWGRTLPSLCKTPPYVTAEPVVTTTTISPADMSNAFIVMGTDGLWEKLTNEEVVGLVGRFLDRKTEKSGWFSKPETFNVAEPPQIEGAKRPNGNGKRSRKWVWQDGNAATHLIRNALGGGNEDEICGIMSLPSPLSRHYRDDISVSVIFLGDLKKDGQKEGMVYVNEEATAGGINAIKSKL